MISDIYCIEEKKEAMPILVHNTKCHLKYWQPVYWTIGNDISLLFDPAKGGHLSYLLMLNVIWANQKTNLCVLLAMSTCNFRHPFLHLFRASNVISIVVSIGLFFLFSSDDRGERAGGNRGGPARYPRTYQHWRPQSLLQCTQQNHQKQGELIDWWCTVSVSEFSCVFLP